VKSLQIVGRKKSGKTSLLIRLIPLLQARGLRVGSVKHSSHPHSLDREGSDSWRHRQAGSEVTIGITAASVSIHLPRPADAAALEARIAREAEDLDLLLIEGWSERRGPKIEVLPPDAEGRPKPPRFRDSGELLAVVLGPDVREGGADAAPGTPSMRCFGWGEIEAVAAFVEAWLRQA
jgi:molybdopterin-guanine dinucleotide biosynthesis protein MobB